jgi:hypothetical protein
VADQLQKVAITTDDRVGVTRHGQGENLVVIRIA